MQYIIKVSIEIWRGENLEYLEIVKFVQFCRISVHIADVRYGDVFVLHLNFDT